MPSSLSAEEGLLVLISNIILIFIANILLVQSFSSHLISVSCPQIKFLFVNV